MDFASALRRLQVHGRTVIDGRTVIIATQLAADGSGIGPLLSMKDTSIEVNELLQVTFGDKSSHSYASRVEDVLDKNVQIAWPTENGIRVALRRGEELSVSFTRDDAAYGFRGTVENTISEPVPLVTVVLKGPVVRTQRRDDVRVRTSIPVELVGVPTTAEAAGAEPVVLLIKATTLDISGGGFAVCYRDAVPVGMIFEVKFKLPDSSDLFTTSAKVVRCTSGLDAQRNKIHRLGLMFMKMPESSRSRIVRYVFGVQKLSIRR